MTIDAALENITVEMERRWKAIVAHGGPTGPATAIILKNAVLKNLLCANLYTTLCGARNAGLKMSITRLAHALDGKDVARVLAFSKATTAHLLFMVELAVRVKRAGMAQKLVSAYISESEAGLHRLYVVEKRVRNAKREE